MAIHSAGRNGFQSTRPVRGGTSACSRWCTVRRNFNPPAPCGAGQGFSWVCVHPVLFQSTRPVRGGTTSLMIFHKAQQFQSTRPVRGGTLWCWRCMQGGYFNPPAPCGAGHCPAPAAWLHIPDFNPPAPCGAGRPLDGKQLVLNNFNPPAPCGAGLRTTTLLCGLPIYFNPPAPCGAGP